MNPPDAGRVMGKLTAGFDHRLQEDTLTEWREYLEELDFPAAYAAARDLVRTSKYFPKMAEFDTAYRNAHRAQAGPRAECPARCDGGWTFTDATTVVACSRCNPVGFQRQMSGEWQRHERGGDWEAHTPEEIAATHARITEVKSQLPPLMGRARARDRRAS